MTLEELTAAAQRACGLLDAGQVEVREDEGGVRALFVAVRDGRGGRAEARSLDGAVLGRAAKSAWVQAGRMRAWPVPPLPEPSVLPEPHVAHTTDGHPSVRTVVASTAGVLAAEEFAVPRPASPAPDPVTVAALGRRIAAGERPVLGRTAVAQLLHAVRRTFGADAAMGGGLPAARVAECLTVRDDARGRRRFDAEGTPRQVVTLIDRGALVGRVRDASSAPTTGHATMALTLAPQADHLVLVPGDADLRADVATLARPTPAEAFELLARATAVGVGGEVQLG